MKKLFAGIILSLAAVAAMAMPRPSDIENALAARDYQTAKSMTQEVLRERPDSARAHLFSAYVLLKADNDRSGAAAELKTARLLDTNHKVQESALFGRTVAELERAAPVQRAYPKSYATPVATTYVATPVGESALWKVIKWMFWLTLIGLVVYWIYKAYERSNRPAPVYVSLHSNERVATSLPAGGSLQPRPYVNHGRTYDAPPHPIYEPSGRGTVTLAPAAPSTVVVNNGGSHGNGLMTGMMMNEMMHSHSHHHDHGRSYVEREYVAPAPAYEAPRYEAPRTTDYETSRASFSSGSRDDDDWKSSSSSSSSSNDSWSSSDSSSSSSSDSGGGGGWD